MADDFYPFVDSGDPAPDNEHLNPRARATGGAMPEPAGEDLPAAQPEQVRYATRIAIYDDMLSTPRVIVVDAKDVRAYLEEVTNTVYRCMKEQGGRISLMVIREIVENFIHAHFVEPIISILDGGNTIRFADQGPGIEDKERAFEFGVTSADREQKRYIRGTGAGFPMVQQYLENAGGAVSIEDNLGQGTVVTVSVDEKRVIEVERAAGRGAAVRGAAVARETPAARAGEGMEQAAGGLAPTAPMPPAPEGPGVEAAPGVALVVNGSPAGQPQAYPPQAYPPQAYPQQMYPQQGYLPQAGYYGAAAYPMPMTQQAGTAPQMPPGYGYPPRQQAPQQAWPYAGYPGPQPSMPMPGAASAPSMMPPAQTGPIVSERGKMAMAYLAEHGSCGPTDLAAAFGSSNATWSRELEALAGQGLAVKQGQKRVLTDMGRLWLQNQQSHE